ncbi:MAG: pyridoxamine 5'-phosphate oxidase [Planctomycetota bacterium]
MQPPHPDTLEDVLASVWHALARGASDRRHAFNTPTLVTTDVDGCADARTVVLRSCLAGRRELVCHTDVRSPKVAQINAHPIVLWHLYDYKSRVQLRVRANACVISADDDPVVRETWERTSAGSRVSYRGPVPPGSRADAPIANTPDEEPAHADDGLEHFRVVRTVVSRIEWLRLHQGGHRRALFEWSDVGRERSTWLAP